jgi:protein-tyrosine phosphatase
VIDIHCHLLPGIDDGPPALDAALALARAMVSDGITHAVCTPHVFPGRFDNRRSTIGLEFARFAAAVREARIPLRLNWAGEVRLSPEVLELIHRREIPFLGEVDSHYMMLLEMPDGQVPIGALAFVERLLSQGVRPVIVHPERNRGVMERVDKLRAFVEEGCLIQLTAGSLVGQFGAKAQRVAHQLVDVGWAHAVASDAHNLTGRKPMMTEARNYLTQHWGAVKARTLTYFAPAAMCGLVVPR